MLLTPLDMMIVSIIDVCSFPEPQPARHHMKSSAFPTAARRDTISYLPSIGRRAVSKGRNIRQPGVLAEGVLIRVVLDVVIVQRRTAFEATVLLPSLGLEVDYDRDLGAYGFRRLVQLRPIYSLYASLGVTVFQYKVKASARRGACDPASLGSRGNVLG